jgi:NADH:ubiquinone oxidoreductase subunit F (NADH-binding)/NADH:ubiquinone oxidoreductase subunit E
MNDVKTTPFRPGVLVQRLREIQNARGYLPIEETPGEDDLHLLALELGVPLYRIQEVASFFPHFRLGVKPPKVLVQVCRDLSCHLAGVRGETLEAWDKEFKKKGHDICVEGVSCLGRCDRAPVMMVSRHDEKPELQIHEAVFGQHELALRKRGLDPFKYLHTVIEEVCGGMKVTNSPDQAKATGARLADTDMLFPLHTNKVLDDRSGKMGFDWLIDVYDKYKLPPYSVTKKFLRENPDPIWPFIEDPLVEDEMKKKGIRPASPEDIELRHKGLYQLQIATLLGMGGAGAPAFKKWTDVWNSSEDLIRSGNVDYSPEKYIVCNGDESEPGTFKDRELLLRKPHLVVEGVILAGLMLNCRAGYIYIRHEYIEGIEAIRRAIIEAEKEGVIGEKLAASRKEGGYERHYTVEAFVSPGGYICGEQGALLEAMSDRRGQPRPRPPEPQANGLNDKPTVVNNVETLAWVPAITHLGGAWYRDQGYTGAPNQYPVRPNEPSMYKGRRLFSISGDLRKPGVYEVPIGIPLKEVLNSPEYCGGMLHEGAELYAIAPSGPSSGFIPRQLPHDMKSVDDQIRRYKEGLESRKKQNEELDSLLNEHKKFSGALEEIEAIQRKLAEESTPAAEKKNSIVTTIRKDTGKAVAKMMEMDPKFKAQHETSDDRTRLNAMVDIVAKNPTVAAKLADGLLNDAKKEIDPVKSQTEKAIGFVLDASAKDLTKYQDLREKARVATDANEKRQIRGEIAKMLEGTVKSVASVNMKIVPFVELGREAMGGDQAVKKAEKKPEKKPQSVMDKVTKKRAEWETKDDLNRRILYTLEQLKANKFHIDELPLDLNVFRNLPSPLKVNIDILLGGGFVVYDSTRRGKMLAEAVNLTQFFANESCGKCVPCRLGSEKLVILGTDLLRGNRKLDKARKLVDELGFAMKQTSICSLGTSAPNPIYSLMEAPQFRDVEFEGMK